MSVKNRFNSRLIKAAPRSVCTYAGVPHRENSSVMALMTDVLDVSAHGKAKGNLEYSSTAQRRYLHEGSPGKGPLKSKFNR
ncbi:hypothetical protein M514_19907 [Trichuris suis]|uniref:Uncharacterized protein n=1 Tax=Trichuris suis TaxID=68888 RepID=A0A085NEC8_9BILA|nr:hypothetical protein M514_19907 [Trichuris suis]